MLAPVAAWPVRGMISVVPVAVSVMATSVPGSTWRLPSPIKTAVLVVPNWGAPGAAGGPIGGIPPVIISWPGIIPGGCSGIGCGGIISGTIPGRVPPIAMPNPLVGRDGGLIPPMAAMADSMSEMGASADTLGTGRLANSVWARANPAWGVVGRTGLFGLKCPLFSNSPFGLGIRGGGKALATRGSLILTLYCPREIT